MKNKLKEREKEKDQLGGLLSWWQINERVLIHMVDRRRCKSTFTYHMHMATMWK